MKKSIPFIAIIAALFPIMSFAEGDGKRDWAEEAAVGYEKQSEAAKASGDAKAAAIYLRMAQIKRDAGAAAKAGEEFSWDEYHQLNGQLNEGAKNSKEKKAHKSKDGKADHSEKKDKGNPADGFIKTAQEYQKKGTEALESGDNEKANIYLRLASIKLEAAAAVSEGKGFDWAEYHELVGRLDK